MAILRDDPVQLLAQEQVRLVAELRKMPEPALRQASHCEHWTNARVVAHLAAGAEWFQQSVTKAARGDCLPPSIPGGQRLTVERFWERLHRREEELAEKPRAELLAEFDQHGMALVDALRPVAPTSMSKPAWHPSGQWTIARFVSQRAWELAFHGWDVHVALDPSAAVRPAMQTFLVHVLLETNKRDFLPNDELDGLYRFELLGSQAWTTRIFNGKMEYGPPEPSPDATIRMDANHFLLLSTKREHLPQLEHRGLVKIEGDRERTVQLLHAISRAG
jgi:uncharacterized protein (TIGR03083 family)